MHCTPIVFCTAADVCVAELIFLDLCNSILEWHRHQQSTFSVSSGFPFDEISGDERSCKTATPFVTATTADAGTSADGDASEAASATDDDDDEEDDDDDDIVLCFSFKLACLVIFDLETRCNSTLCLVLSTESVFVDEHTEIGSDLMMDFNVRLSSLLKIDSSSFWSLVLMTFEPPNASLETCPLIEFDLARVDVVDVIDVIFFSPDLDLVSECRDLDLLTRNDVLLAELWLDDVLFRSILSEYFPELSGVRMLLFASEWSSDDRVNRPDDRVLRHLLDERPWLVLLSDLELSVVDFRRLKDLDLDVDLDLDLDLE